MNEYGPNVNLNWVTPQAAKFQLAFPEPTRINLNDMTQSS